MRISDWSSDVCSSDLSPIHGRMREAIAASRIAQKSLNLCNNARTMIDIAKAGGGIGIFPRPMVRGEVASGALAPIDGMPALAPVEFHVAMRVADTEPVLTQIFERAAKLNLAEVQIGRAHSELQSLMRISYAVLCWKKKKKT